MQCIRYYTTQPSDKGGETGPSGGSTEKQPDKTKDGDQVEAVDEKPKGIFQRFKDAYKEYGKVLVCVHVATSAVWLGSFYYAAYR